MGFIIVAGLLLVSGYVLFATLGRLLSRRAGLAWYSAFGGLVFLGLLTGCQLAFRVEYSVSAD